MPKSVESQLVLTFPMQVWVYCAVTDPDVSVYCPVACTSHVPGVRVREPRLSNVTVVNACGVLWLNRKSGKGESPLPDDGCVRDCAGAAPMMLQGCCPRARSIWNPAGPTCVGAIFPFGVAVYGMKHLPAKSNGKKSAA